MSIKYTIGLVTWSRHMHVSIVEHFTGYWRSVNLEFQPLCMLRCSRNTQTNKEKQHGVYNGWNSSRWQYLYSFKFIKFMFFRASSVLGLTLLRLSITLEINWGLILGHPDFHLWHCLVCQNIFKWQWNIFQDKNAILPKLTYAYCVSRQS